MKRFIVLMICTLITGSSMAFAQNWAPGPPVNGPAPMPLQTPGPDMNGALMFPGPGGLCAPPSCQPSLTGSVGVMVGWQINDYPGRIKFTTQRDPQLARVGTTIKHKVDGLWLGVSGRAQCENGFGGRLEFRNLFPSTESAETTVQMSTAPAVERNFKGNYFWRMLDGSGSMNVGGGVSLLGGLRWDYFGVKMTNPPNITALSSTADEADLTVSTLKPYGGAEFAVAGCDTGIALRVIGSPYVFSNIIYGNTYGDPLGASTFRDEMKGSSKAAAFIEATLTAGKKVSSNLTLGGYGSINTLFTHTEKDMSSTHVNTAFTNADSIFDVDLYRYSVVLGGNAAVSF